MIVPASLFIAILLSLISFFLVRVAGKRRSDDNKFKYGKGVLGIMLVGAIIFPAFGMFSYFGGLGGVRLDALPILIISIVPFVIFLIIFFYLRGYQIMVGAGGIEVRSFGVSKYYSYESIKELRLIKDVRGGCTLDCHDKNGFSVFTVWSGFEGVYDLSKLIRSNASSGFLYTEK